MLSTNPEKKETENDRFQGNFIEDKEIDDDGRCTRILNTILSSEHKREMVRYIYNHQVST